MNDPSKRTTSTLVHKAMAPVISAALRLAVYRQQLGILLMLVVFVGAGYVCWHMVREIEFDQLRGALMNVSPQWIGGALLAALGSYTMLLGYEWSAARFAGVEIPSRSLITAGMCASAVGNAIGLSMLSGGAVRCRLYFQHGLNAADVARMSVFVSLALGCALPPLAAVAALVHVGAAAGALHLPPSWVVGIAIGVLVFYALIMLLLAFKRLPTQPTPYTRLFHFGRWHFRLPNIVLSLMQLVITLLDVICAATVLYLLIPGDLPFMTFLLVYLLALATGVLSHVPGGFGVFEAIVLTAFAGQVGVTPLTAALLLYRAIYVLLPLILACLTLLMYEAKRLWCRRTHK